MGKEKTKCKKYAKISEKVKKFYNWEKKQFDRLSDGERVLNS